MNINNILNDENFIQDFYQFNSPTTSRPVIVSWNGTGVHSIAGPTPLVDISKSFNTNSIGVVESIVHTINLTGKVFPSGIRGINNVVSGINQLETLFRRCTRAPLQIKCDNTVIFEASGVEVKSMSFNKTNDNWVQSADYTIDLEYKTGPTNDPIDQVEERQESWSIEPLDDAVYTKFSKVISQRSQYYNPKLKPTAPTLNSPIPAQSVGGGQFGGPNATANSIQIFNIPQFRITRRLSAKGFKPYGAQTGQCLPQAEFEAERKSLYYSAKAWVDKQSLTPFNAASTSGSIVFSGANTTAGKTWAYNHSRSVNVDIYNGTYETNDTWIAMPTGIPYIETFSVEASTDIENTKTVRVAGNIQGLIVSSGMLLNNYPLSTGLPSNTSKNILVDLSGSLEQPPEITLPPRAVPSVASNSNSTPSNSTSDVSKIKSAKYLNALDAWTKDIKPYLYRRACLAINTDDRESGPNSDPTKPPPNPVYVKEILLNVNPVSTSEGHDPIKGTISYSHEFNNKLLIISGVISENIRISNTAPVNNIQETQILGRALGPLLSIAGSTNPRKTITIDIVVPKGTGIKATLQTEPSCPLYVSGHFWTSVDQLIRGNAPFANRKIPFGNNTNSQEFGAVFKDSDTEDWNPTEGRYNRSVSWIYQQCTTDKFYLDH